MSSEQNIFNALQAAVDRLKSENDTLLDRLAVAERDTAAEIERLRAENEKALADRSEILRAADRLHVAASEVLYCIASMGWRTGDGIEWSVAGCQKHLHRELDRATDDMRVVLEAKNLTVYASIAGKGSRTVGHRRDGSAFTRPDNPKQKSFAEAVASAAVAAGIRIEEGQRVLSVVWYAPRPSSHLTKTGKVKNGAPLRPSVADGDKVLRNIADALEGIAWRNDRSVRPMAIDCHFGEPARCEITIEPCPEHGAWRYEETTYKATP